MKKQRNKIEEEYTKVKKQIVHSGKGNTQNFFISDFRFSKLQF